MNWAKFGLNVAKLGCLITARAKIPVFTTLGKRQVVWPTTDIIQKAVAVYLGLNAVWRANCGPNSTPFLATF